jgi:hypothetical protein
VSDPDLITLFVRPLNVLRVPYMVTGGVAAVVYGEPRLTRDIDLVIVLSPTDAPRFASAWSAAEFYTPPLEVIEAESRRPAHGHLNVIHHASTMRAHVYFAGTDELSAWGLAHRVVRQIQGEAVHLAPMEYVIVNKLGYFRMGGSDRHLRDVAQMMSVSGASVDRAALDQWVDRLGLGAEWARALSHQEPA